MHDLSEYTTEALTNRLRELVEGPASYPDSLFFYSEHEDDPWNSIEAIEAELVRKEMRVVR